jgi:hypothetical protein
LWKAILGNNLTGIQLYLAPTVDDRETCKYNIFT